MRQLPLRWQIPLLYAAIMLVVLAGGGALLYQQQQQFLVANAAMRLRDQARSSIDRRAAPPGADLQRSPPGQPSAGDAPANQARRSSTALADLAEELASRDMGVSIYSPDATLIATGTRGFALPFPGAEALAEASRGAFDRAVISPTQHGRVLWVLMPAGRSSDGPSAIVQLGTPIALIDDALNGLALYLAVGICAALTVATALGVAATRRALRPLQRVADATQRIAAGDLSQRVGISGASEVGQLGSAFDRMVAQLEATFAAQKRFVADAAHELRTPLTALSGSVELLRMGVAEDDPEKSDRLLRHLDVELARVIRLTNDMLTLSSLDAQSRLSLQSTDLSALLRDMAEQYASSLSAHDFRVDIADGLYVLADGDRLRQVFINLLDNARKHTPAGKAIALRAWRNEGSACVEVRDEGSGIPSEALPKLFDRFYRVDDARSRNRGGSGLGLAIVRAIVDAHHGTISVVSEDGFGSGFTVGLPIA